MDLSAFEHLGVTTESDGRLVLVELNHGKANECGRGQLAELDAVDAQIRADPSVRCLILYSTKTTRSGKSVFVAGANVTERVGWTHDDVKAHVHWQRGILSSLRTLPVFSIMIVDGLALGLGTELLLTADWRIGTPRARLGLPETGLGIVPGALGTAELATLVGPAFALYMGATGEQIGADDACRVGLLQQLSPTQTEALEIARGIALKVMTRSPRAVAAYKHAVKAGIGRAAEQRVRLEAEAYEGLVDGGDAAIGRAHFKDIREGKTPPWSPREAG